eukprot:m.300844 g.300844  ORF g.300844 m.300844 type:complete len:72 (+) comp40801_c0_seq19:2701-2916(+)
MWQTWNSLLKLFWHQIKLCRQYATDTDTLQKYSTLKLQNDREDDMHSSDSTEMQGSDDLWLQKKVVKWKIA